MKSWLPQLKRQPLWNLRDINSKILFHRQQILNLNKFWSQKQQKVSLEEPKRIITTSMKTKLNKLNKHLVFLHVSKRGGGLF